MRRSSTTPREIFCNDFVNICNENALFLLVEESVWLQLINFLTIIAFWFVKCLFVINRDTLN